jgi:hypothetical protein
MPLPPPVTSAVFPAISVTLSIAYYKDPAAIAALATD